MRVPAAQVREEERVRHRQPVGRDHGHDVHGLDARYPVTASCIGVVTALAAALCKCSAAGEPGALLDLRHVAARAADALDHGWCLEVGGWTGVGLDVVLSTRGPYRCLGFRARGVRKTLS